MSSWLFLSSAKRFEKLALQAMRQQSLHLRIDKRNLRTLAKYQNSPAVYDVLNYLKQLCSKPLKGFEKFFKDKPGAGKGGASSANKQAASGPRKQPQSAAAPKNDAKKPDISDFFKLGSQSGGGGGGGGKGFSPDPNDQRTATMIGLGVVGVLGIIMFYLT